MHLNICSTKVQGCKQALKARDPEGPARIGPDPGRAPGLSLELLGPDWPGRRIMVKYRYQKRRTETNDSAPTATNDRALTATRCADLSFVIKRPFR